MWVYEYEMAKPGDVVFLAEISPQDRATRREASLTPWRTNVSREARLRGWCGNTDNVDVQAIGGARIVRRSTRDPDRVLVRLLPDDDAAVADAFEECAL